MISPSQPSHIIPTVGSLDHVRIIYIYIPRLPTGPGPTPKCPSSRQLLSAARETSRPVACEGRSRTRGKLCFSPLWFSEIGSSTCASAELRSASVVASPHAARVSSNSSSTSLASRRDSLEIPRRYSHLLVWLVDVLAAPLPAGYRGGSVCAGSSRRHGPIYSTRTHGSHITTTIQRPYTRATVRPSIFTRLARTGRSTGQCMEMSGV